MKLALDAVITATLVVCALVTTGLVVRREFFAPAPPPSQAEQKPLFIKGWRTHLSTGIRMGSEQAPLQLLEFADFECPFCASFHRDLKVISAHCPTKVSRT